MARHQPETPLSRAADEIAEQGILAVGRKDHGEARRLFQRAADMDEDCLKAHAGLSLLRFPGLHYLKALEQIHRTLRPRTYLEIGVATGESLARTLPETRCIGVDPAPSVPAEVAARAHVHTGFSADFFAKEDVRALLGGLPLDLGFIDGSHLFEDALDDFIAIERFCGPRAAIMMHDCLPIHPVPAARERKSRFWTGDVWRVLPTLARYRPDLKISVIACAPSGLAFIQGLDPGADALARNRDAALAYGRAQPFAATTDLAALGIHEVPAQPEAVARLVAGGAAA